MVRVRVGAGSGSQRIESSNVVLFLRSFWRETRAPPPPLITSTTESTMALMSISTPDMRDYESTLQTLGLINAETQVRGPATTVWVRLVLRPCGCADAHGVPGERAACCRRR